MELAAKQIETPAVRVRWGWYWLIPIGLFVLAVALYIHSSGYELFYSWDDNRYIAENYLLRNFSLQGFVDIWTHVYFAAYLPVTITSYWVEFNIWGMSPGGYHVVNVLLNGLNSALVYIFLNKLIKNRAVALMATLLWIVHPLQVETVVWVAERKSILAMLFTLLAFIAYFRSAEDKTPRQNLSKQELPNKSWGVSATPGFSVNWMLVLAYIFFFLAVFAKPAVVGLPVLFMAYDYYFARMPVRRVLMRAIVPIIIGLAGSVLIVYAHEGGGGIKTPWGGSRLTLSLLMLMVFWDYVVSFVAPWTLNNFYRYDDTAALGSSIPNALVNNPISIILGALLILSLIYIAWKQPFGKPFSRFAVLWVVVLMLPVINIIPIAIERADRYMYMPSVVIFAVVAILINRLWHRLDSPAARYSIVGVFTALIVILAGVNYIRSLVWQNEGDLWVDHLKTYPQSQTGWLNLGVYYYNKKDYTEALPVFKQLVTLSPADFKGNRFLGHIAIQQNRPADAVVYYRRALQTNPKDSSTFGLLGLAYYRLEDYPAAVTAYSQAVKLEPDLMSTFPNLGNAALRTGKYALAEQVLRAVVGKNPKDANSTSDLCAALAQLNRKDEAIQFCADAVQLTPQNGFFLGRLASLYLDAKQPDKALPVAQQAVSSSPGSSLSYRVLGEAYAGLGQKDRAIAALQKSLQLDSTNSRAQQILNSLIGS